MTSPDRDRSDRPDFTACLEHPCPSCGAKPGETCVGGIAEREGVPHPKRMAAYLDSVMSGLLDRKARMTEWIDVR